MVIEPLGILTLLALTIVLGYVGMFIFKKTRIPDVIWLLLFGILVGPVFNLIDTSAFVSVSPLLGAVALVIILFDAGLNMNFYQIIREIPRSFLLAFLGVILTAGAVALVSMAMFNFDMITGLILGAMVGGTSGPIVLSIVTPMKIIKPKIRNILNLESIITDPIIIVIVIALIQISVSQTTTPIATSLATAYSTALVIGFIAGITWLVLLDRIRGKFDYMLTLSFILLLYVGVESLGGSGAISALIFGIVLGNGKRFTKFLRFKKLFSVDYMIKRFQREITFFMKSFFFVYMGIIASFNITYFLYGVIITGAIILVRMVVIKISTYRMAITKLESNIMKVMIPRGLAAAVLAQLPLAYGVPGGEIFLNVTFIIILFTVLYTVIATRFYYKP
jgi:cell volume regulation protein A